MRPLTFERAVSERDEDLVMLLNARGLQRATVRFMRRLLNSPNASLRSRGGLELPNEIWEMIFGLSMHEFEDVQHHAYCTVQVEQVERLSETKAIVHCSADAFDVKWNENGVVGIHAITSVEQWLQGGFICTEYPEGAEKARWSMGFYFDGKFTVDLEHQSGSLSAEVPVLFREVTMPDIVKYTHEECGFCEGEKRWNVNVEEWNDWAAMGLDLGFAWIWVTQYLQDHAATDAQPNTQDPDQYTSACPGCMGTSLAIEHRLFKERVMRLGHENLGALGEEWRDDLERRLSEQAGRPMKA